MGGAAAAAKQAAASKPPGDGSSDLSTGNAAEKPVGKAGQTVSFDPKDLRSTVTGSAQRTSSNSNVDNLAAGTKSTSLHVSSRLGGPAVHGSTTDSSANGSCRTGLAELDETDAEEAMQKAMEERKRPSAIIIDASLVDGEATRSAKPQQPLPKETQTDPEIVGTPEAGNRWVPSNRWSRVQSARYGLAVPPDADGELRTTRGPRLGLGGSAWVDNSDFHSVRTPGRANEIRLGPDTVACRSPAGNRGSHVVSLPEIPRLPASERGAVVKDLHEGMRDSTSSPDNSPFGTRDLMMDFSLESPRGHRPRHGDTRGGSQQYVAGGFNSQFHSCRGEEVVAHLPSRGAPARR